MIALLKTYVEVEFDGQTKLLKYDYNSVAEIEISFGKGIGRVLTEENVGFNVVRLFYWAGLKWKQPGITLQVVGNMLGKKISEEGLNIADLMEPVMEALKRSKLLGAGEEENSEGDPEADGAEKN